MQGRPGNTREVNGLRYLKSRITGDDRVRHASSNIGHVTRGGAPRVARGYPYSAPTGPSQCRAARGGRRLALTCFQWLPKPATSQLPDMGRALRASWSPGEDVRIQACRWFIECQTNSSDGVSWRGSIAESVAQDLMKARSSSLTWCFRVVHMPWGAPL
jgi:hypothetical protein